MQDDDSAKEDTEERNCAMACAEIIGALAPHRRVTAIKILAHMFNVMGPFPRTEKP